MSFAEPANRRVAGHGADRINPQRNQYCAGTCPARGNRSFGSGVPAANHDDIEMFHVKHSYFPIQKLANISPSNASVPILPTRISKDRVADRNSNATSSAPAAAPKSR